MIAVVAMPTEHAHVARLLMPDTGMKARSADRLYFFYEVDGGENVAFDDFDGALLIETHNFATMPEAQSWMRADARLRQLINGGLN